MDSRCNRSYSRSIFYLLTTSIITSTECFLNPIHRPICLASIHSNTNVNTVHNPRVNVHVELHQNHDSCEDGNDKVKVDTTTKTSRRQILHSLAATVAATTSSATTLLSTPSPASATDTSTSVTTNADPPITHKVTFNVRISRADGTFYVRDDPPGTIPTFDNQVFTGSLTFGLYGTLAPNHVSKFLQYANSNGYDPFEEYPLPSYSKSQFTTFTQSNGLLIGGNIPGLQIDNISGAAALEYRGKISAASLWIDDFVNNQKTKLSHGKKGLLTHRNLDVLPNFGITTRDARELDGSYTVFGQLISTESSDAFLRRVVDLPTYSNTRPVSVTTTPTTTTTSTATTSASANINSNSPIAVAASTSSATAEVTSSFYSFQKDLFRSAAKTFGDTRLDNIYEGKILRRIEVTSVSVETM